MRLGWLIGLCLFSPASRAAEVVDRIVAVVGDEIITQSDVAQVEALKGRLGHDKRAAPAFEGRDPLEELVNQKLMLQEIKRLNLEVTPDELNRMLQNVLRMNQASMAQLRAELANKGMTLDEYKERLKDEVRRMKFIGQNITPRVTVAEEEITQAAGAGAGPEERQRLRVALTEKKTYEELRRYLQTVREKTYIDIRK